MKTKNLILWCSLLSASILAGNLAQAEVKAQAELSAKAASLKIGVNLIDQETRDFLKSFLKNPKTAIQMVPSKFSIDGSRVLADAKSQALISGGKDPLRVKLSDSFKIARDKQQSSICVGEIGADKCLAQAGRRGVLSNDRAENLADNGRDASFVNNIYNMANITQGEVALKPWSSTYWPIASGITANRYRDSNYPQMDWHSIEALYQAFWAAPQISAVELSPAEKYDLLLGDNNWTLTKAQIEEGRGYAFNGSEPKQVEGWMGICHGWSPASYMDPRPTRAITAISANGQPITFLPDDLKALSSLKWANGRAVKNVNGRLTNATRFIGGRCNTEGSEIATDPETGAISDEDCFDTNPASWHKSIVNQIGLLKRSFVMDATYDYQVWNQPVTSYSYTYFNPATMADVSTIQEATQPIGFAGDKFAKHRSQKYDGAAKQPASVVGVIMEVSYLVETAPQGRESDDSGNDAHRSVRYIYDLEVAADGEIIGGEWYENAHPDFLWTPAQDAFAYNSEDSSVSGTYDPAQAVPANMVSAGISSSASNAPLKAILDGLLQAAAK